MSNIDNMREIPLKSITFEETYPVPAGLVDKDGSIPALAIQGSDERTTLINDISRFVHEYIVEEASTYEFLFCSYDWDIGGAAEYFETDAGEEYADFVIRIRAEVTHVGPNSPDWLLEDGLIDDDEAAHMAATRAA